MQLNLKTMDWTIYLSTLLVTAIYWAQPFSGGPRVPSVILMILGIILFVKRLISLEDIRLRRFITVLTLFFVPAVLSLISSYDRSNSLKLIILLPLFIPFAAAVLYLIDNKINNKLLFSIVTVVSVFWVFDGLIQFVFGHDLFGVPPTDEGRIVGPFAHHLRLSLFLSISLPLVLLQLKKSGWIAQLLYLAPAILVIMLSGVRTDLLTALLAIVLYVIVNKHTKLLLGFIPFLLVGGMLASHFSGISETKLKTFSGMPDSYQKWNLLSSHRLDIWLTAKNMVLAHPITGVGARNFSNAYDDYATEGNFFNSERVFHAHHPMISIAAETGLIGLAGLFMALWLLYKWGRESKVTNLWANPWLQILVLMFFPIQSMPLLFTLWWFPIVTIVMLFYLSDLDADVSTIAH